MGVKLVKLLDRINNIIVTGGIVPKGSFNINEQYNVGDFVSYGGFSYVLYEFAPIGTLPSNDAYWQIIVGEASSKWENDGVDAIKPVDNKLVDYKYLKNKPDLSVYQKMSFDSAIGSFLTTE